MQIAVFIDFDNIEIGVKTTLNTELDLSLVLEALKERGEVISKSAYGDWARAGMHSRTLTDHAVHMVQRNVTPRGDKNGADINLVVDALEMAFTRPHINGFVIVGGDSDFIALVEKLKQFGKRVLVVGGRSFTSGVLQRNCHEFISYENLLSASRGGRGSQSQSRGGPVTGRLTLNQGFEKVQRALKILADRGVEPQLGPLKSTLLQLDSTFSERDYGASSFREFIQRLDDQGHLHLRRIDQGYLVEMNGDSAREPAKAAPAPRTRSAAASASVSPSATVSGEGGADEDGDPGEDVATGEIAAQAGGDAAMRRPEEAMDLLRTVVERVSDSRGGKPMYVRHLAQGLRAADPAFDEQAYGFRTLTELVHLGQREGILRMQRDRQGAWRITAVGAAAPAAPGASPETAGFDTGLNGAAAPEGVDGEPGHEAGSGDAGRDRDPADEELAAGGSTIEAGSDAGKDTDSDAAAAPPAEGADDAPAPKRSRRRRSPATASGEKPARATKSAASGTRTSTRTPRSRASGTRKKATPED